MNENKNIDVKSFTFFRDYFNLLKLLNEDDKKDAILAILEYVFDGKNPTNKNDKIMAIFNTLSSQLNKSISNSKRCQSKNNSTESETGEETERETESETERRTEKETKRVTGSVTGKVTNNISTFLFIISNNIYINNYLEEKKILKEKIEEWLEYKDQKKDKYVERGLKQLLTTVINNTDKYGEDIVMALIDEAMANNWKGIVWERADKIKVIEKQLEKKTNDLDEYE